jgi:hypothetical protein
LPSGARRSWKAGRVVAGRWRLVRVGMGRNCSRR